MPFGYTTGRGFGSRQAFEAIGIGYTTFEGHDGAALRAAIAAGTTHHHGTFHPTGEQLGTFRQQLRKYGRDMRANVGGRLRRDGTGRDLGYPRELDTGVRAGDDRREAAS